MARQEAACRFSDQRMVLDDKDGLHDCKLPATKEAVALKQPTLWKSRRPYAVSNPRARRGIPVQAARPAPVTGGPSSFTLPREGGPLDDVTAATPRSQCAVPLIAGTNNACLCSASINSSPQRRLAAVPRAPSELKQRRAGQEQSVWIERQHGGWAAQRGRCRSSPSHGAVGRLGRAPPLSHVCS